MQAWLPLIVTELLPVRTVLVIFWAVLASALVTGSWQHNIVLGTSQSLPHHRFQGTSCPSCPPPGCTAGSGPAQQNRNQDPERCRLHKEVLGLLFSVLQAPTLPFYIALPAGWSASLLYSLDNYFQATTNQGVGSDMDKVSKNFLKTKICSSISVYNNNKAISILISSNVSISMTPQLILKGGWEDFHSK